MTDEVQTEVKKEVPVVEDATVHDHFQVSTCKFLHYHMFNRYDNQRVGQRFCNLFVKHAWPELFYQINPDAAAKMIDKWLTDHHYTEELPPPLDDVTIIDWPGYTPEPK